MPQPRRQPPQDDRPDPQRAAAGLAAIGAAGAAVGPVAGAAATTSTIGAVAAATTAAVLDAAKIAAFIAALRTFFRRKERDDAAFVAALLADEYPRTYADFQRRLRKVAQERGLSVPVEDPGSVRVDAPRPVEPPLRPGTWTAGRLAPPGSPEADAVLHELAVREMEYERKFEEKALARVERDMARAQAIEDAKARARRVQAILRREQRYVRMRSEAMAARSVSGLARHALKQLSPRGAYWHLSPFVKEHTLDCLYLGGKWWPWAVLDVVHPPLHAGCPCQLYGLDEAIEEGFLPDGFEPPDADGEALRIAMALLERARRLEEGRSAYKDALEEAYNPDQPRYPKGHPKAGQWRPKVAAGVSGKRSSRGWMERDLWELREQVSGARMLPNPSTERLARIGDLVSRIADRYGTHHAYRERIMALHEEKRRITEAEVRRAEERAAERGAGDDVETLLDTLLGGSDAERRRRFDIDDEIARLLVEEERARRDALAGALAQVRRMGGPLRPSRVDGGTQRDRDEVYVALSEIRRYIPEDWLRDASESDLAVTIPEPSERAYHRTTSDDGRSQADWVRRLVRAGRGETSLDGYLPDGGTVIRVNRPQRWIGTPGRYLIPRDGAARMLEPGEGHELRASPPRVRPPDSIVAIDPYNRAQVLHELAHRLEQVVGERREATGDRRLYAATGRFLFERTRGERSRPLRELTGVNYAPEEVGRRDDFVDPYIGRDYGARPSTEILSMGLEMLFYTRHGTDLLRSRRHRRGDDQMRSFLLGMLAAL